MGLVFVLSVLMDHNKGRTTDRGKDGQIEIDVESKQASKLEASGLESQ